MEHTGQDKLQQLFQQHILQLEASSSDKLSVNRLLVRFWKEPSLKSQYGFIENLFQNHANVVYEMIEWVLMPKKMAFRKGYKNKFQPLIYLTKNFMKENWCFYEILFIQIKQRKFPLLSFFQFLQPQNYDPTTIDTALGYFSQIMIPFVKYGFSASHSLLATLQIEDASKFGGILQIITQQVLTHVIQHAHHKQIYDFLITAYLVGIQDEINYERSKILIDTIFQYCQNPNILVNFQQPQNISQQKYVTLFEQFCTLENVSKTIKQILENIEPNQSISIRMKSILIALLRSNLIYYIINELLKCSYINSIEKKQDTNSLDSEGCVSPSSIRQKNEHRFLVHKCISFSDHTLQNSVKNLFNSTPLSLSRRQATENLKQPQDLGHIEQDEIIEMMLKILTTFFKIYQKMSFETQSTEDRDSDLQEIQQQYQIQIIHILQNMKHINQIVYHQVHKQEQQWIHFSSGQLIVPTKMIKYQYFRLLYQVLLTTAQTNHSSQRMTMFLGEALNESQDHIETNNCQDMQIVQESKIKGFNIDDLHIIEIIERYLCENKWNNIAHHILQKIFHTLVVTRPEYLIKNIQKDKGKKISNSFLAYLFQNFLQKQYIFLDTFRFTSQGNLHSLFTISKYLAYSLNSSNNLVKLLNEFDGWKKFIMEDLKKYEQKVYPAHIEPDRQLRESYNQKYDEIKIDEVDTISKLIEDISVQEKWPIKSNLQRKTASDRTKV